MNAKTKVPVRTIEGFYVLHEAVREGDLNKVKDLIEGGMYVNLKDNHGDTPLERAMFYNHKDIITYLVEHGANVNAKKVLKYAVWRGNSDTVQYLLDHGADVNAHSIDGTTAIFEAAENRDIEKVKLLIANGADIYFRPVNGYTLLHCVVFNGFVKAMDYICKQNNINDVTNDGETALYVAVKYGRTEMVEYLVEKGAYVNIPNNDGYTPLVVAIYCGYYDIIAYLLEHGASPNMEGKLDENLTMALSHLKENAHQREHIKNYNKIVNLLENHGIHINLG